MTHDEILDEWAALKSEVTLLRIDVLSLKKMLAAVVIDLDTIGTVTPKTQQDIRQAVLLARLAQSKGSAYDAEGFS